MKNDELRNDRLMPLGAMSEYTVAKDSTNIVGWRVIGADGESLGTVKDLIVDTQVLKVRYLSVLAENKFFDTDRDQHVLIPIGAAALDKKGKNVFVSYIDSRSMGSYPVYAGDNIPEDYEYAVRDTVNRAQNNSLHHTSEDHREEFDQKLRGETNETRPITNDFYENEAYNEQRFYTSDYDQATEREFVTNDYDNVNETRDVDHNRRPKTVEDSIATIERLENLRKRGSITDEEFILMKKRALDL